jgi:hypothetical protein
VPLFILECSTNSFYNVFSWDPVSCSPLFWIVFPGVW